MAARPSAPTLPDPAAPAQDDWAGPAQTTSSTTVTKGHADRSALGVSLAKFQVPDVVFGVGALAQLGGCVRRLGGRKPFLVTDSGLVEAGWAAKATAHLRADGLSPVQWTGVTPNPKDHEVEAAFQHYGSAGADVIVAIGGGSCIDAAKGVAILSGNGGPFSTTRAWIG